jgi:hypothetical protein
MDGWVDGWRRERRERLERGEALGKGYMQLSEEIVVVAVAVAVTWVVVAAAASWRRIETAAAATSSSDEVVYTKLADEVMTQHWLTKSTGIGDSDNPFIMVPLLVVLHYDYPCSKPLQISQARLPGGPCS